MIDLETSCRRDGAITRVRVTVHNGRTTPQRVELESTLDGPVWAPESGPIPTPEWDGDTWTGVVGPGTSRGLGFATPAEPVEEPLRIVSVERATEDPADGDRVILDLDEAAPPASVAFRDA